jgi:hypothetical protein
MLSMLFQWFNATAYLPNDKTGEALEKLKSEYLPQWLQKVIFFYQLTSLITFPSQQICT